LRRDSLDRLVMWGAALRGTGARPVFGFGPDRFTQVAARFPATGSADLARVTIDNAHNTPLQIASTAGVVAAAAWLTAVLWPLVAGARDAFSASGDRGRLIVAGLWIGALGYVLSLQTGISTVDATTVFWIVAACLVSPTARSITVEPMRFGWFVAALLGLLVVGALGWGATQVAANNAYLEGRMRLRGLRTGSADDAYRRAIAFAPLDFYYHRALGVELAYRTPAPAQAGDAVDAGLRLEPEDLELLVARARLAALRGDTDAMRADLGRAWELAPGSELVSGFEAPAPALSTTATP